MKKHIVYTLIILTLGVGIGIWINQSGFPGDKKIAVKAESKSLAQVVPDEAPAQINTVYWITPETVTTGDTTQIIESPSFVVSQPGVEYVTTPSGYVYTTGARAVDSGPVNPYWTMGANGMWQNPTVDPPTCARR